MKTRISLVSNSSSCSFMITNNSDKILTIEDFVKENPQLIDAYRERYQWNKNEHCTQDNLIKSAKKRLSDKVYEKESIFAPKEKKIVSFGDQDGDLVGQVFDYMLRDDGKSQNFEWHLVEMNR